MSPPKKLFLELNDIDGQYHVNDENGFAFGAGSHEPTTSIKSARTVTDAPISIGDSYAGFERLCVSKKPDNAEADGENFIQMLAEIGGMKVTKLYNDDLHFIGYTMELKE